MPAAAQPEQEFSIQMMTGISAPPIGKNLRKQKHTGPIRLTGTVYLTSLCGNFPDAAA
jgi:hypothetical protein